MTLKDVNHKKSKEKMGEKRKQTKEEIKNEIRKKTAGYIVGGLAIVAGLAWNDAIKTLIEEFFPQSGSTIVAKIIYAALLTVVIVITSYYVTKLIEREAIEAQDKKEEAEEKEK